MRQTSHRLPRKTAAAAFAGCTALGIALTGGAVAHAAPSYQLCTFTYLDPSNIDAPMRPYSAAWVTPTGEGHLDAELWSYPAYPEPGFNQRFSVTWANLDTGLSGSASTEPVHVDGERTILSIPDIATGAGRITFVFGAANDDGGLTTTNGDCSAEHTIE